MRLARVLVLVLPLALAACSAEPAPTESGAAEEPAPVDSGRATDDGVAYGAAIGEAPLVTLGDLVGKPEDYDGKTVRVEGLVTGVCAKRGCWINVGEEDGPRQVTFKVEDGVMVFPMSARGKWAEVEGVAKKLVLPVEKARDYLAAKAKESGEPFDPASVTEPLVLVRLSGLGAVVRDTRPAAKPE